MNMKRYRCAGIALVLASAVWTSCLDSIEDYYSKAGGALRSGTVYEHLRNDSRFSRFADLVDETGMKEILSGEELVTVWAPADSSMPASVAEMSADDKLMLVQNHISVSTIYSKGMSGMSTVSTLAGKYLNVTKSDGIYRVGGAALETVDQLYSNGLVHEISGWLVPDKNISQWLSSLPDTYSVFRDSLYAHNSRTFDKTNSPVIGIDENGTVIYDSLFIVKNDYLNNAELDSESARYTMFVPSNEALAGMYSSRAEYFSSIGREMTAEDSTALFDWVMKAALHRGSLNIHPGDILKSIAGKEIRVDYETLADTLNMSNGRIYTVSGCYVPKDVHYSKLEFNPYYIRREILSNGGVITTNNTKYDKFYNGVNNTASKVLDDLNAVYWQFNSTSKDNFYQFEARDWSDSLACTLDMRVMPGKYTVRMQFINYGSNFNTDALDIYEVKTSGGKEELLLIGSIAGIGKKYFYTESPNKVSGIVNEDYEFTGGYEKRVFRAVIPGSNTDGTKRRICVGICSLTPNDNY